MPKTPLLVSDVLTVIGMFLVMLVTLLTLTVLRVPLPVGIGWAILWGSATWLMTWLALRITRALRLRWIRRHAHE